jgi:hypothetical protein
MHLFEGGWCASVAKAFVHPLCSHVGLELDILLECIRESSRSSVRNQFPRINFSGDVTSMTQIVSHEWPGVLLVYLIAIQTPQGHRLLNTQLEDNDKKNTTKRYQKPLSRQGSSKRERKCLKSTIF